MRIYINAAWTRASGSIRLCWWKTCFPPTGPSWPHSPYSWPLVQADLSVELGLHDCRAAEKAAYTVYRWAHTPNGGMKSEQNISRRAWCSCSPRKNSTQTSPTYKLQGSTSEEQREHVLLMCMWAVSTWVWYSCSSKLVFPFHMFEAMLLCLCSLPLPHTMDHYHFHPTSLSKECMLIGVSKKVRENHVAQLLSQHAQYRHVETQQ